jgi:hypothetical protein
MHAPTSGTIPVDVDEQVEAVVAATVTMAASAAADRVGAVAERVTDVPADRGHRPRHRQMVSAV